MKFILPMPPSLNAIYARTAKGSKRDRYKTKEATSWERHAGYLLNSQKTGECMDCRLEVEYKLYFKTNQPSDIANREKITTDLLVKHQVIADDSLIDKMTIIRMPKDKDNPRVEITVKEFN